MVVSKDKKSRKALKRSRRRTRALAADSAAVQAPATAGAPQPETREAATQAEDSRVASLECALRVASSRARLAVQNLEAATQNLARMRAEVSAAQSAMFCTIRSLGLCRGQLGEALALTNEPLVRTKILFALVCLAQQEGVAMGAQFSPTAMVCD